MTATGFRLLIVASFALQLGDPFVDMLFPNLMSAALAQAIEAQPLSPYLDQGWFLPLLIGWVVALVVSIVGLLLLKRWARGVSLWVTAGAWVLYPMLGPSASSGVAGSFAEAGAMLWGAALAVAYFSPLRARFGDTP